MLFRILWSMYGTKHVGVWTRTPEGLLAGRPLCGAIAGPAPSRRLPISARPVTPRNQPDCGECLIEWNRAALGRELDARD